MTDTWAIKGAWFKNCNCDPGCPCDFNQNPTHGHCEGVIAMRIDQGHFGHVDLGGLKFAGAAYWPGRIDEGDGHIIPIVDESADEEQRQAILTIMSGQAGGTLFEIFSAMCPHVREPVFAPIDFEFDLESRKGRLRAGDIIDSTVDTLGSIGSDEPYRILVRIPGGFEYTGPNHEAETALSKTLKVSAGGELDYEHELSHSSMALVEHSGVIPAAA
ncbi:MAG TPA: DUF1326 domain-containing protein [Candidatus Limnocylindrales bacterium]|jgi:hypothetical protein|nr:DUF1326 domain-containing protein [Candidatus Limnocylindrales bacterium]